MRAPVVALLLCVAGRAAAQTCDTGFATDCAGSVEWVDGTFETSDGFDATTLTFATYITGVNGCIGYSYDPASYAYSCWTPGAGDDIGAYANDLDWNWTQHLRCTGGLTCKGEYDPSAGRIMDLGADANRVAVFPIIDHMAANENPCEAFEYTVWLSDDWEDPDSWQLAELYKAFTDGWTTGWIADGYTTVWRLPCGQVFRYVSLVAGNMGNPTDACAFDSSDDEIDAVAGLNEDETGICIDLDFDGFGDSACGGPDCDDTDPDVRPGAVETCLAIADMNCDGVVAGCPVGADCVAGQCLYPCVVEGGCPPGLSCEGDVGYCSPPGCFGVTCDAGLVCVDGECVDPCQDAVCPPGQVCQSGACVDPCAGVTCPENQVCIDGPPCDPSCSCTGCDKYEACDEATGLCVPPACVGVVCGKGDVCVTGVCEDGCTYAICPVGQACEDGFCAPDLCFGLTCPGGFLCVDGDCVDACEGVACGAGELCQGGECVPAPDTGGDGGGGGGDDGGSGTPPPDAQREGFTADRGGCGCALGTRP